MLLTVLNNTLRNRKNKLFKEVLNIKQSGHISRKMNPEKCVTAGSSSTPKSQLDFEKKEPNQALTKNKEIPVLRHYKQKQAASKTKAIPHVPGTVTLQILGTGVNGSPQTMYLFTDNSRYIFNCGEGTQRLAYEHKTKLSRLEQIFLTRNSWSMVGGLPGLALTVQDAGITELTVNGPPYLDKILYSMNRFVVLKTLQLNTNDCSQPYDYEDTVMSVKCVPLHSNSNTSNDKTVIAYICRLKPRPGALNLQKCVGAGVPPGPLLGQLKNGIDVTLSNGNVVRSKDVSEPSETALSFVVLDIPSAAFMPALQQRVSLFQDLQLIPEYQVALVVHFTPTEMLQNIEYQAFMSNFSKQTQHIYLSSPKNTFSGYMALHRTQYQLNQLHPRIFPVLGEAVELGCSTYISNGLKKTKLKIDKAEDMATSKKAIESQQQQEGNSEFFGINTLTNFHLRPRKGLDHSLEAKLCPSEYIQETQALPDFPAQLEKLKASLNLVNQNRPADFPKITFLGTGSCAPNKTRNVSAILLQPQEDSYILFDCGEGTLGQIVRFFGYGKAEEVMRKLKVIYVSHLHADHHIGLIGLLIERQRLSRTQGENKQQKLLVLAPIQIQSWLDFYDEHIEQISDTYTLIGNATMLQNPLQLSEIRSDAGLAATIGTCFVRHCPHSFGICLHLPTAQSGKQMKITYSGDTMPCPDLVRLGRNSTILIHEATMEDDLIREAELKMHSTTSQAINQGRAMEAEHIILTHFSQRYAKLPRLTGVAGDADAETMRNVSIAFDNMQVTPTDLQHFHLLYPALKALFAEHAEELEQKALKREQKLERKRKLTDE